MDSLCWPTLCSSAHPVMAAPLPQCLSHVRNIELLKSLNIKMANTRLAEMLENPQHSTWPSSESQNHTHTWLFKTQYYILLTNTGKRDMSCAWTQILRGLLLSASSCTEEDRQSCSKTGVKYVAPSSMVSRVGIIWKVDFREAWPHQVLRRSALLLCTKQQILQNRFWE
jgi:hypothetical protein